MTTKQCMYFCGSVCKDTALASYYVWFEFKQTISTLVLIRLQFSLPPSQTVGLQGGKLTPLPSASGYSCVIQD